jgi:iron complex transport system substrate-binding protein
MMNRLNVVVAAILLAGLMLSACSPAESLEQPDPGAITLIDDLGRTVVLNGTPRRIVSTAPSLTEILFAIGAGDLVVGRDDFSNYPDAAQQVTSFGSLWGGFPAEAILGMAPDLILAAEILSPEQVQALEDLGLTVYWQANPHTFEELYENIAEVAQITGHAEEAAALTSSLRDRVQDVTRAVAGADNRPVVFYELDATDPNNPWTAGQGTFVDLIITTAGGANAAAEVTGEFPQFSLEALIEIDPDFILLGDADFGVTAQQVAARGGWSTLQAVKNGRVYPIDSNWMSVPGPRLVDGLEAVARLLHPELFE